MGVQEARNRSAFDKLVYGKWWVIGSKAEHMAKGGSQGGCQLWISLATPWAVHEDAKVRPDKKHIAVVISSPEVLAARMITPAFTVLHVVAHGPHAGRGEAAVGCYWKKLTKDVLAVAHKDDRIILMTDSNSHLHAQDGAEVTHAAFFATALRDLSLANNIADDPLPTFESWTGSTVQDDYVATSSNISTVRNSQRIIDFAHSAEAAYHEPVALDIKIHASPMDVVASRRAPAFDRSKLKDPVIQQAIVDRLAVIEVPPKHLEQTTRCHLLSSAIHDVLVSEAPLERKVPRQSWISEHTMKAIAVRDRLFKRSRHLGVAIKNVTSRPLMLVRRWVSFMIGRCV